MNTEVEFKKKRIILLGAGTTHLAILKKWSMNPIKGAELVLVTESPTVLYSGMVPGFISKFYQEDELKTDLRRFCSQRGIELITGEVERLDQKKREIMFFSRPSLKYSILSINLGSVPNVERKIAPEKEFRIKPFSDLPKALKNLDEKASAANEFHILVVGGGPSGCELVLSFKKRYSSQANVRVSLASKSKHLLPHFPKSAGRKMLRTLQQAKVEVTFEAPAHEVENKANLVVWATSAVPPPFIERSNFPKDHNGFISVDEHLRVKGEASVFAVGDCASFPSALPKNGVVAVREAETLWENLQAAALGHPLRKYVPQSWFLSIFNTCNGKALLSYGPFSHLSKMAFKWKDHIDKKWMSKYVLAAIANSAELRCGGCGSKTPSQVLSQTFARLGISEMLGEDAAIIKNTPNGQVQLQTLDLLKAFTSDLYVFGKIAAIHALNDIYAMNGVPTTAVAVVTLPPASIDLNEEKLYLLLKGALEIFESHGVSLVGGHTTEAQDLSLGFSITGEANPSRLFEKSRLKVGDTLLLTKPLGSGVLLASLMRGECRAEWYDGLLAGMLRSNKVETSVLGEFEVACATDISGFGLGGHLLEMLQKSAVSASINSSKIPLYSGVSECFSKGIRSTIHSDNFNAINEHLVGEFSEVFFDPQTSGGILAGVPAGKTTVAQEALKKVGVRTWVIGEVIASSAGVSQIKRA